MSWTTWKIYMSSVCWEWMNLLSYYTDEATRSNCTTFYTIKYELRKKKLYDVKAEGRGYRSKDIKSAANNKNGLFFWFLPFSKTGANCGKAGKKSLMSRHTTLPRLSELWWWPRSSEWVEIYGKSKECSLNIKKSQKKKCVKHTQTNNANRSLVFCGQSDTISVSLLFVGPRLRIMLCWYNFAWLA
jgi:hypothetical protein